MKKVASFCALVASLSVASAATAQQFGGNSVRLVLRAEVQPFCRISSTMGEGPLDLVGDNASLGQVREVCNTNGYTVRAAFENLSSGSVVAGGERATVDAAGVAQFSYNQARALTRPWQLESARKVSSDAPVYLRLSISPI